jgi:hypothetical protein
MHDPIGLMGGELPAETLAAPYAADLARGCGAGLATLPDVHDPDVPGLRRWPPALAEAARAGIEQVEARTRWQPGDPWLPELVP